MEEIYNQFRDQVEFFSIYIQEAHPTDGWQVDNNARDEVLYQQHQTYDERETIANTCQLDLKIPFPMLIEEMDNAVDDAYGAAPERLYLIGTDGKIAYKGGIGPFLFNLDEWEQAIEIYLDVAKVV